MNGQEVHKIYVRKQIGLDKLADDQETKKMISRDDIRRLMNEWKHSWNRHDLDGVMELFHDSVLFENWDGKRVVGKKALKKVWEPWFKQHGEFAINEEDTFIDEINQKVLFQWKLEWPSSLPGFEGKIEKRRGLDVLHFRDGKIFRKYTYSKTTLEIDGKIFGAANHLVL